MVITYYECRCPGALTPNAGDAVYWCGECGGARTTEHIGATYTPPADPILAEREACAAFVESLHEGLTETMSPKELANAIRQRDVPGESFVDTENRQWVFSVVGEPIVIAEIDIVFPCICPAADMLREGWRCTCGANQ